MPPNSKFQILESDTTLSVFLEKTSTRVAKSKIQNFLKVSLRQFATLNKKHPFKSLTAPFGKDERDEEEIYSSKPSYQPKDDARKRILNHKFKKNGANYSTDFKVLEILIHGLRRLEWCLSIVWQSKTSDPWILDITNFLRGSSISSVNPILKRRWVLNG